MPRLGGEESGADAAAATVGETKAYGNGDERRDSEQISRQELRCGDEADRDSEGDGQAQSEQRSEFSHGIVFLSVFSAVVSTLSGLGERSSPPR